MNENDNKYVNEVLKKLNELNAVERFPMNDRGSADLFATIFKNVSRYNPTKKDWMYYDKTRWTADTEGMRAKRNAKMLRILSLFVMDFIGGLSPERTIIMKIMTQDKTRVLNFKMTYISYVSKNRICEGDFGIAEYASPERAKEVLNDMFQKYAAGEKAYIMPEE